MSYRQSKRKKQQIETCRVSDMVWSDELISLGTETREATKIQCDSSRRSDSHFVTQPSFVLENGNIFILWLERSVYVFNGCFPFRAEVIKYRNAVSQNSTLQRSQLCLYNEHKTYLELCVIGKSCLGMWNKNNLRKPICKVRRDVLWFEFKMAPTGSCTWTLGPQMVVSFREVVSIFWHWT